MSSLDGTRNLAIPYGEMVRVRSSRSYSWSLLGLGLILALLVGVAGWQDALGGGLVLGGFASLFFSTDPPWIRLLYLAFPLLILLISLLALLAASQKGYELEYGDSRRLFLPEEFAKAFRIADEQTPRDLFGVGGLPQTTESFPGEGPRV